MIWYISTAFWNSVLVLFSYDVHMGKTWEDIKPCIHSPATQWSQCPRSIRWSQWWSLALPPRPVTTKIKKDPVDKDKIGLKQKHRWIILIYIDLHWCSSIWGADFTYCSIVFWAAASYIPKKVLLAWFSVSNIDCCLAAWGFFSKTE